MADYKAKEPAKTYINSDAHKKLEKLHLQEEKDRRRKTFADHDVIGKLYSHVGRDIDKLDELTHDEVHKVMTDGYLQHAKDFSGADYDAMKKAGVHDYKLLEHLKIDMGVDVAALTNYVVQNGSKIDTTVIQRSNEQTRSRAIDALFGHELANLKEDHRNEVIDTYFKPQLRAGESMNYQSIHNNPSELGGTFRKALNKENIEDDIRSYAEKAKKKK